MVANEGLERAEPWLLELTAYYRPSEDILIKEKINSCCILEPVCVVV